MIESTPGIDKMRSWQIPGEHLQISTIDAHTGGEPLRIVISGLPPVQGQTMLEKRQFMAMKLDHLRRALMWEPRGHADMYGCLITEPVSPEADFGVLFMHNEGYSTMCGHGIIAVTTVAIETGFVNPSNASVVLKIDSPAGLIVASARIKSGRVTDVTFVNVPSFVQALDQQVDVPGIGKINFDLAFGGAFYAYVKASEAGVDLIPENYQEIIRKGMAIKHAVMKKMKPRHPFEQGLDFLYGTIFIDEPKNKNVHSRNVCVFAEGEVDRSPTGTGVSGRLAIQFARGEVKIGESLVIESILGSTFNCTVRKSIKMGDYSAVVPEVTGSAFITGKHTFVIDPNDSFKEGFIFR